MHETEFTQYFDKYILFQLSDFIVSVFDGVRILQRRPLESLKYCE